MACVVEFGCGDIIFIGAEKWNTAGAERRNTAGAEFGVWDEVCDDGMG